MSGTLTRICKQAVVVSSVWLLLCPVLARGEGGLKRALSPNFAGDTRAATATLVDCKDSDRVVGSATLQEKDSDEGIKEVFGQKGNFSGKDILNMLLDNPQTARYVVSKIYRYFVNEKINEIGEADILIGIPSFNNSRTIGHVVKAVQTGLSKYFPDRKSILVNSDGGSRVRPS